MSDLVDRYARACREVVRLKVKLIEQDALLAKAADLLNISQCGALQDAGSEITEYRRHEQQAHKETPK